ncbi:hypothetical protein [Variovorax sp. UMC13]|uniref:hypothetical protein n=1 Tax=Variovorax sp. UMC13 TaxID=1862326 RepID=UPI0016019C94|nr:hypothetical protein [Variovorax sp. UMC13]
MTTSPAPTHDDEPSTAAAFGPFNDQARELAIQTVAHCSSVITAYGKILSGEKPTSRATLVLAESERRDYFGEMREKRRKLIERRLVAAEYLLRNGQRMRKIAEYRAALAENSAGGAAAGPLSAFAPIEGQAMACLVGEPGQIADIYLVEPSAEHPGFFFLSHLSDAGACVDYLTKPMRADYAGAWLRAEGLASPETALWRSEACPGVWKAGQSLHSALEAA